MQISPHLPDVARTLEALDRGLLSFVNALAHSDAVCVLERPAQGAIRVACEAYSTIHYGMEDKMNTSVVCPGAIGVSTDLLKLAQSVNDLKADFKAVCTRLSQVKVRVPVKGGESPTRAIPAIRAILRNIQRSDVNLLAAYRKIPILKTPPVLITFTRAFTRAVYQKSVDELYTMLLPSEHPKASADRARLQSLDPRETYLALVMQRYRNLRANVFYARLDARGRGRVQIAAELPILYAKDRHEAPEIRFPEPDSATATPARSRQSKTETTPFLESLPVYRYNMPARHGRRT